MKFDKENLKALFIKERLIGIGVGAFVAALFAGSCWYAWYCGNQAYMENGGVAESIDAEVAEVVVEEVDAAVEEAEAEAERIKAEEEAARIAAEEAAAAEAAAAQSYTNYNYNYNSNSNSSSGNYSGGYYDFMRDGVVYDNGNKFTYYSQSVLPGGGLNIPGRHTDGGFVRDGDGYIVIASDKANGTVVDTPWGQGKVYDKGTSGNHYDVYVE